MSSSLENALFYGILDTGYVSKNDWLTKYDALVAGGAGIIQVRAKKEDAAERRALLEAVLEHREGKAGHPPLVINDDIDLCKAHPTVGLHIGQDDTPPEQARDEIGPDRILGLSTHSPDQATRAMELGCNILSYFAVGPVFATQTKPDYVPVGLDLVRFVAKKGPELPFFCIGGINRASLREVAAAGAKRVVTVSDVLCACDTAAAVSESVLLLKAQP